MRKRDVDRACAQMIGMSKGKDYDAEVEDLLGVAPLAREVECAKHFYRKAIHDTIREIMHETGAISLARH